MAEDRQQRRLATIFAADVFGYSRLTAENEEETHRTLKAHRAVIDRLIARHDGRIFTTAGDSVVAEFGSAVEAVRCAISIQEELRVRNAEMHENRRMDFRIGINVGDVLVDGDNLYGDGVNIAARLEDIAVPGSVYISGSVFALVKNKLSYAFEDIGPQTVKNIPEPVPAYRLTPIPIKSRYAGETKSINWRWPLAAASVVIIGIGAFYWSNRAKERIPTADAGPSVAPRQSTPAVSKTTPSVPAQPPSVVVPTTTSAPAVSARPHIDAAALERMQPYVGKAVEGISTVTGKPFAMMLKPGGLAEVKIELATSGSSIDQGSWWIEPNGSFCVHYTRFAGGNPACRVLVVENGVTKAYTWDHRPNPWIIKK
jgi:adenylate cyclase